MGYGKGQGKSGLITFPNVFWHNEFPATPPPGESNERDMSGGFRLAMGVPLFFRELWMGYFHGKISLFEMDDRTGTIRLSL